VISNEEGRDEGCSVSVNWLTIRLPFRLITEPLDEHASFPRRRGHDREQPKTVKERGCCVQNRGIYDPFSPG
jgi:hypothetical protein